MKARIITFLLVAVVASSAKAIDRSQLDARLHLLAQKLDLLQQQPDKRIPAETLRDAKGIVLLDRTKAGFLFAYQGGAGVALARNTTGQWSAPAFVKASDVSLGFQAGGEHRFVVILFMTTNAARLMADTTMNFAAEAQGTAGADTRKVEAGAPRPSVLVYDDTQGLYGGATFKGGSITADKDANAVYYGGYISVGDIVFGNRAQLSPAAEDLVGSLRGIAHAGEVGAAASDH
jgi:lipid-binding SYLF domain-containing protein